MNTLLEILSPDFLLRDALLASLLIGLICPLAGVYFILRRMVFLGVALPQVSSAGIACSFLLYGLVVGPHVHLETNEHLIAASGSLAFTLAATLILVRFERRRDAVEARIGTVYAVAAAATILILAKDPHGDAQMVHLLKGDMLGTTPASLAGLAVALGAVAFAFFCFRRELLLVSFDRDLAVVLGKRVGLWDLVLFLLIGVVISVCVMSAGPVATFGFMVVPAVTVHQIARNMLAFTLGSAALGLFTALGGFYCAYRFDFPLGPAEIGLASLILAGVGAWTTVRRLVRRPRSA